MRFKIPFIFIWFLVFSFIININSLYAQNDNYTVSNAGSPEVNGVYIKSGTYQDVGGDNSTNNWYTKISGTSDIMKIYYYQSAWTMLQDITKQAVWYYYWYNASLTNPAMPEGNIWGGDDRGGLGHISGGIPLTTKNSIITPTFSSGSGYSINAPTLPSTNHPIGRFQLTGGTNAGVVLQALTISLTGTRTNVSNVKLWSSSSSTFNTSTATQLNSKSDATSITFNSFNSLVDNSSGTYYFITVDLAAGATGSVTATIPSQASFTFAGANNPSSFTNAALSSGAAPLPVELTSFTASTTANTVTLNWNTATEVNNYGFNIECRTLNGDWNSIGFVNGHGNSNSPKNYSFIDKSPIGGKSQYRLKQIDFDGKFEYSPIVNVDVIAPSRTVLKQNFPNPFNPATVISYQLSANSPVLFKVYDVLGREVATLVNEFKNAGNYEIQFDGSKLTSGIYFYSLNANGNTLYKKMILTK